MKVAYRLFVSLWVILAIFTFLSCSRGVPVGTWQGTVEQPNSGSYPVVMSLDKLSEGSKAGKIDYPTLKCGGVLTLIEIKDRKYILKEKMEYGKGRCVDGGSISIMKTDEGKLVWRWFYPNGQEGAYGTLEKSK